MLGCATPKGGLRRRLMSALLRHRAASWWTSAIALSGTLDALAQEPLGRLVGRALTASVVTDSIELVLPGPIVPLSAGGLAIADYGSLSVILLDSTGRRTAILGGQGRAPGQFAALDAMGTFGDTVLWVTDGNNRRLSARSLQAHRFVSSSSLDSLVSPTRGGTWAVYAIESAGNSVLTESISEAPSADARRNARLLLRRSDGTSAPLGTFSWGPSALVLANRRSLSSYQPFSDNPILGRSADGRWVTVVQRYANARRPVRVTRFNSTTGTADSIEVAVPMTRLTTQSVDSAARHFATDAWQGLGYASFTAAFADVRRGLVMPTFRPAAAQAVTNRTGSSVWLELGGTRNGQREWLEVSFEGKAVSRSVLLKSAEQIIAADTSSLWTAVELDSGEFVLQRHMLVPLQRSKRR